MPRLKQIDIQGFKSFAEPTTLIYPTGITAIVGPNGSGKSNVADAIRWVLGEQRMTSLRGRSGEDMIFAGSKRRARAGMARAAITFDNSDGWMPVDFTEVIVERRTYRDGKTDYMLNGSRVRLMDVRDLLNRVGLGRDSYLVIGQGLVDQVLSLRPSERLALFEQAAGIAPYRSRREDAVKRLTETQRNLERVQDIVGEIEPRLRRLARQAERVQQHAALSKVLHETLLTWYGYRWWTTISGLDQARQRVTYHEERVLQRMTDVDGLADKITALRQQSTALRSKLAALHRESSARHTDAEREQRELAVARERHRQLEARLEERRANLVPLQSALEVEKQEVQQLSNNVAATVAALDAARADLEKAELAHRKVAQQRHALLARQSKMQARALEYRHQLADRQSRLEQAADRRAQLAQRIEQLTAADRKVLTQRRAQQTEVEALRRRLEAAEADEQAAQGEVARVQDALDALRAEQARLRSALNDRQAAYQQAATRLDALERLHAEGTGLYAGVRAVLQAAGQGDLRGLPGPVAELMHVPSDLDRAIEVALGSHLQDIVAERWEDARAAITWLKRKRAGRATFLPLDNLRASRPLTLPASAKAPDTGVIGLASDLVEIEPKYSGVTSMLLGRTVVVRDLEAARALHRQLRGGYQIVTLAGEIVRSSGAVTGGEDRKSRRGGGLLARERERRELPERVTALEQEVQALQTDLREGESQTRALTQESEKITAQQRLAARQHQEAGQQLNDAVRDLDRLLQEMAWHRERLDEAKQEREQLEATRAKLENERQAAETALQEAEARLTDVAGELDALTEDETAAVVAQCRTQVALLTQEHDNRRVLVDSHRREMRRLGREITNQTQRVKAMAGELTALDGQLEDIQARYDATRQAADALSAQVPPLEAQLTQIEKSLEQLEEAERAARRTLREAEHRLTQVELDANRREEQVQALRREIEEALGIVIADVPESLSAQQPLPLEAIVSQLPIVQELPEGLERQIRDLRTQIRRLGPVNPGAQEEYEEVSERHSFLREQMDDLKTASAHLKQIIAELDEMMNTSFRTTFKAIASEFSRMFELLFNGGTARLRLESEDDEIVGVEITARPPGKRTSGLGMLSGGERALTAVALLFAVMRVSPTPFCVLDEVDAMLDEANVGRFRSMLNELSRQTQFILITHNRGTVEVADTIYGVSMRDDGASQILSLSLEDLPPSEVI